MPELPDVEQFRSYIDSTSLHKKITDIRIFDKRILENTTEKKLASRLKGHSLTETYRRGKYLFLLVGNSAPKHSTDDPAGTDNPPEGPALVMHFGMTGYPVYQKISKEMERHCRLSIEFSNGYRLEYVLQRLLGRVRFTGTIEEFIEEQEIGLDVLSYDYDTFNTLFNSKRKSMKSLLMDQNTIAGIGNIYADEILFQSGLHPKTKTGALNEETKRRLFEKMHEVMRTAIENNADIDKFPDTYIIPFREPDAPCPVCATPIKKVKVNGRNSYYCPSCRKKGESIQGRS